MKSIYQDCIEFSFTEAVMLLVVLVGLCSAMAAVTHNRNNTVTTGTLETNLPATVVTSYVTNSVNYSNARVNHFGGAYGTEAATEKWTTTTITFRTQITVTWEGKEFTSTSDELVKATTKRWKISPQWEFDKETDDTELHKGWTTTNMTIGNIITVQPTNYYFVPNNLTNTNPLERK